MARAKKLVVARPPQNRMKRAVPTAPAPQAVGVGPAAPGGMNPQLMAALLAKAGGGAQGGDGQ